MKVLAIESSCDETACALVQEKDGLVEIISNVTASSAEILNKYGGIVPEVAAREQVACIIPVIESAIQRSEFRIQDMGAVAVAYGPGLIGSLLIGIETAKTLALAWNKPLIRVNHMAAHVFANWIVPSTGSDTMTRLHSDTPGLPAIGLVVSGGHTDIILLKSLTDWQWLGGTRDDAAGEAYDKAARAMGLPYPGGPQIARMAELANTSPWPSPTLGEGIKLPRPMIHEDNLEMSFSGLKTAVVQMISSPAFAKASEGTSREQAIAVLAREFNEAVVDVLVAKTMKAVEMYNPKSVLVAGGVAANRLLRSRLEISCQQSGTRLFVPDLRYCTDNAAMVGAAAIMIQDFIDPLLLKPDPGLGVI